MADQRSHERPDEQELVGLIGRAAQPLNGGSADFDGLLEMIGEARLVLLGEASHGTHEFYRQRALITRRLIEEKGFGAVAVEADWPDAYRVNCWVRGAGNPDDSIEPLSGFLRFPHWMWRNNDVVEFIGWLRAYNSARPDKASQAGFYGLDLYSLFTSLEAVIGYLEKVDPAEARRARDRYACFADYKNDPQAYGYAVSFNISDSCHRAVVDQLLELCRQAVAYSGLAGPDEQFYAEQNARLIKDAEEYYRTMFKGGQASWNLRDCHMTETLDALLDHLERQTGGRSKIVVWAHNSHLGDARATEMGGLGQFNVGQLVRERYGQAAVLVGFSTYTGTVTAASDWDGPAERKRVRPGLAGSYEELFHRVGRPGFFLNLRDAASSPLCEGLRRPRLERAIGVIYRPQTERWSHYFEARLPDQFDALLYTDETSAVVPLERNPQWENLEAPETFPSGV